MIRQQNRRLQYELWITKIPECYSPEDNIAFGSLLLEEATVMLDRKGRRVRDDEDDLRRRASEARKVLTSESQTSHAVTLACSQLKAVVELLRADTN